MPNKQNDDRRHHIPEMSFQVQNSAEYEAELQQCGSLNKVSPVFRLPLAAYAALFVDAAVQTSNSGESENDAFKHSIHTHDT